MKVKESEVGHHAAGAINCFAINVQSVIVFIVITSKNRFKDLTNVIVPTASMGCTLQAEQLIAPDGRY